MDKTFNLIIVAWLLILTIFTILFSVFSIYYISYDREMQSLDLKLDEININTHEAMIEVIIDNSNRISNIESSEVKRE